MDRDHRSTSFWTAALLITLLAATVVRAIHLADNPGWDGDEGYNWSIASNLLSGRVQRFALKYTFVDHPPLFYLAGALLMKALDQTLLPLRILSVSCSIAAVASLYALGTCVGGRRLGLLTAVIYALWPLAIVQARWAYTYNLLALLVPVALWAVLRAGGRGRHPGTDAGQGRSPAQAGVIGAGILAGLALATDQEGVAVVAAVAAAALWQSGVRRAALTTLCALAVPLSYLAWMLALRGPDLMFDIQHTAGRLSGAGGETLPQRLIHLWQFDSLILPGMLGLFALPAGPARRAIGACLIVLLVLALRVRDPAPYFRAAIPMLPLLALGAAALLDRFLSFIADRRSRDAALRALVALALGGFAVLTAAIDVTQAVSGYYPAIASGLPRSTGDAEAMASWVNGHTPQSAYVIAMPQVAWLLHCRTAELLQAVAISGHGTEFYPDGLTAARFAWDTRLSAASYLVVDRFTDLWISVHPLERALVDTARRSWPMVYHRGEYRVYRNVHVVSTAF